MQLQTISKQCWQQPLLKCVAIGSQRTHRKHGGWQCHTLVSNIEWAVSTSISAKQYVNINDEKADNQWGVMKSLILE